MEQTLEGAGRLFPGVQDVAKLRWLLAYVETGDEGEACRLAGVHRLEIRTPRWTGDQAFQEAMDAVEDIRAEALEAHARRLALEGVRKVRFDRYGTPFPDPYHCWCGSRRGDHREITEDDGVRVLLCPGEDPDDPDRREFEGRPYEEVSYPEGLIQFLLKGSARGDKYRQRSDVRVTGGLATLDLSSLPMEAVQRIADGEHPIAVLSDIAPGHPALAELEAGEPDGDDDGEE